MSESQKFCLSCGAPTAGRYCEYCVDEKGALKPREEIHAGITQWLSSWGDEPGVDFAKRAESYMNAMPAWAPK